MLEDRPDFEATLPNTIQKCIADLLQGEKEQVLHLDCLSDELYGAINAAFWAGNLTEEQADYLRKKYLFPPEPDEAEELQMR